MMSHRQFLLSFIAVTVVTVSCNINFYYTVDLSTCDNAPNEDLRLICRQLQRWDTQVRVCFSANQKILLLLQLAQRIVHSNT